MLLQLSFLSPSLCFLQKTLEVGIGQCLASFSERGSEHTDQTQPDQTIKLLTEQEQIGLSSGNFLCRIPLESWQLWRYAKFQILLVLNTEIKEAKIDTLSYLGKMRNNIQVFII